MDDGGGVISDGCRSSKDDWERADGCCIDYVSVLKVDVLVL